MSQAQMLMLHPDAFCEHTMLSMQQNATAAGAPSPDPLAGFKEALGEGD